MRRQAQRRHEQRPAAEQAADEATTAEKVVEETREGYREWAADPSKSDYPGVDSGPDHDEGREIDRMGFIEPLSDHRLEATAEAGLGIAEAAGFGGIRDGGFDSLQGIDAMVMGDVHAPGELEVESATEGGPLELDNYETLYSDDGTEFSDLDPNLPLTDDEDPDQFDWLGCIRCQPEERI